VAFIAFLSGLEGEVLLREARKVTLGSIWCEPNGVLLTENLTRGGSVMVGVGELDE